MRPPLCLEKWDTDGREFTRGSGMGPLRRGTPSRGPMAGARAPSYRYGLISGAPAVAIITTHTNGTSISMKLNPLISAFAGIIAFGTPAVAQTTGTTTTTSSFAPSNFGNTIFTIT